MRVVVNFAYYAPTLETDVADSSKDLGTIRPRRTLITRRV